MRGLLVVLALLASSALAQRGDGRFERFNSRCVGGRTDRGLPCDSLAWFEFAPTSGAGMGAACACTTPTGAKGEALMFTRSTSAYCTNDSFELVLCATNQARVMRGRPNAPLSLYTERLGQNDLLHARDLSQAVWTKSANMSCTKTATGVDTSANAASTCTSSAATQTVIQATVAASAANSTSLYIKRRTGTGTVEVTNDNGGNWYDITSSLSSSWKRVVCIDAPGCSGGRCIIVEALCATSANPTVGLRLATSGDAVDVDFFQNEALPGFKPTSPMASGAAKASRGADVAYIDLPSVMPTVGSLSVNVMTARIDPAACVLGTWQSNTNFLIAWNTGTTGASTQDLGCGYRPPAGLQSIGSGTYFPGGGFTSLHCQNIEGSPRVCMGGTCNTASWAGGSGITNQSRIYFSCGTLSQSFDGLINSVCVDPSPTRCGPERTRSSPAATHIAWLGDSITFGNVSTPTRPPYELYRGFAQFDSKSVLNAGLAGDSTAAMRARWESYVRHQDFGTLVVMGGVNDLRGGSTAVSAFANLQAIYDDARGRGMTVIPVLVSPWGNYVQWTAGKQTETLALNTLIQDYCTTYSLTCVDAYTALSAGGGTPEDLSAAYDSGDGLHPNAAGSAALAAVVGAALP